jgi:hypothetical protein
MITAYTITIYETEDTERAVKELEENLSRITLKSNTAGMITCSADYVDSGVASAIGKACPFDTAGMTTSLQSSEGEVETYTLILTILTSDDVRFAVAATKELTSDKQPIRTLLSKNDEEEILKKLGGKPELGFVFVPLMNFKGDAVLDLFSHRFPGVPVFGSKSINDDNYGEKRTILVNGELSEKTAFILMSGEVKPRFYISRVKLTDSVFNKELIVTKSTDNILKEINNRTVTDELASLGFYGTLHEQTERIMTNMFEFVKNEGNSNETRYRRYFLNSNPDAGELEFNAYIPNNSVLRVSKINKQNIIESATETKNEILKLRGKNFVFIVSCVARKVTLGEEAEAEAQIFAEGLRDIPYLSVCSGGEFCCLNGTNTFQAFTTAVCVI